VTRLEPAEWRARKAAHEERVDAWIGPHLRRRQAGGKNAVEDFLFTYYSCRPAQLRRWPDRAPHLGCFGMHEWAMVYRQRPEEVRHNAWPLRLGAGGTATVVEAAKVRCSHFDAFRFFTEPARALNVLQPTREAQPEHEQPGCLHANMDLYKWAYKLTPLVPSELVADCFALAREIRILDMRASPYDLTELGYPPVRVEDAEGRQEYAQAQRSFAERAAPLRARLIGECGRILG
jgi:hypothetical protein